MKAFSRTLALGLSGALVASALAAAGVVGTAPEAAAKAVAITAGTHYGCAITPAGALFCWGNNISGQLGDGTLDERSLPVKVKKMAKGALAVAAGSDHTCAIKGKKRTLFCWGYNLFGQLGNGESGGATDRRTPVKVKKMSKGVRYVSTGDNHTCAIKGKKDTLFCWGWNNDGRLGIGSAGGTSPVPVKVKKMAKEVKRVSAGRDHTCAIKGKKGILFCWGSNNYGRLGDGSQQQRNAPRKVKLAAGAKDVSAGGEHTCAIRGAGNALFCWGHNFAGQIGDGQSGLGEHRLTPVKVKRMGAGVRAVGAGGTHTCAIKGKKRALFCWGANASGQIGNGDPPTLTEPLAVQVKKMPAGVKVFAGGANHTCATKGKKGIPFCWGWNGSGQLGNGGNQPTRVPVKVKL